MSPRSRPSEASSTRSVADLFEHVREGRDRTQAGRSFATGFEPLDKVLGGGLRAHDLTLIGGLPGVGKTILALQWARSMALGGSHVLYVCYEHSETELLARLLCLELGTNAYPENLPAIEELQGRVRDAAAGQCALSEIIDDSPLLGAAAAKLDSYADKLWFIHGSGRTTDLEAIERLVSEHGNGHNALIVDYLQKVALPYETMDQTEKMTRVAEGLKDISLRHNVAIIGISAAEQEGMASQRLRLHHMRGSSALAYECDVAILLHEKAHAVSKVHLAYDPVKADTFRNWVVASIEKNRRGPAQIDLEFRKDFANFRFEPEGGYCTERLVDERFDVE